MSVSTTSSCATCGIQPGELIGRCVLCTRVGESLDPALVPSPPLILPGSVGFSVGVLAKSRRNQRFAAAALALVALTTGAVIALRADSDAPESASLTSRLPSQPSLAGDAMPDTAATTVSASLRVPSVPLTGQLAPRSGAIAPLSHAPASLPDVPSPLLNSRSERVTLVITDSASAFSAVAAPRVVAPQTVIPQVLRTVVPLPAESLPALPRIELAAQPASRLDSVAVRSAIDAFVTSLRSRASTNVELLAFYGDGAEHKTIATGAPSVKSASSASVHVSFDIRLMKYDAVGRQMTRILPVTMLVALRDAVVTTSAVTFGALRRP